MILNKNKLLIILKPYFFSVILLLLAGLLFKTLETCLFYKYQDVSSFIIVLKSFFNITTVFCFYALLILPLYLIIALFNKKIAQIFISVFFALLLSFEIALFVYSMQTGVLMGMDILMRPLSEILITIRNSSNIFIDIVLFIIVMAYFVVLPFLLKKIKIFNNLLSQTIAIAFIGLLSFFTVFYQKNENHTLNIYVESKTYHFFSVVKEHINAEPEVDFSMIDKKNVIEKNEQLLKEYIDLYNNKSVAAIDYPMERPAAEFPDVLSPFFNHSEKQPNIVIIIVESLGNYLLGDKGNDVTFTPFLDSLANVGLYWKNCMSTGARTYSVIPSVMGSVPHGIKGFQFGMMPQHHSLFSLLNKNGYVTNFFYGGDVSFDSMFDFVSVQDPNHIDNFLPQMKDYKKKQKANWWGLYDHILFEESVNYIKTLPKEKPLANVYLTLTTHEPFNERDKELQEYYEKKAEVIYSTLDNTKRKYYAPIKDRIGVFLYFDDCIRSFIYNYAKQIDNKNTIFIITGDHSISIFKNNLSQYHVPLIIWSPLLKRHQNFPNIVSHEAITPSIISYLHQNYSLKIPKKLAWNSTGLDTSSVFNPLEKILFISYDRKVNAMLYHQYYFEEKEKKLYEINEDLDLEEVNSAMTKENIYSKFITLKYVNNYVYHNDKLIKTDHITNEYKLIKTYSNHNTIVCKTPDTIPSIAGISKFDLMPAQTIKEHCQKIKIKLMADVVFNDYVYQDQQMNLNITCSGKDLEYTFKDHITKYIADENIECNKEYTLLVEREVNVKDIHTFSPHIFISSNIYDQYWKPDKKITISNVKVLIYGK